MARTLASLLAAVCVLLPAAPAVAAPTAPAPGVVVAVLDGGVDARHPALARAMWHGGGIDLVGRDADPTDPRGHGTHVAGLIAGRGVGHARGAKLMPVRVSNRRGLARARDVAAGLRWSAARGARVINLSIGYFDPADGPLLASAIADAGAAGALVVAAAGNGGEDLDRLGAVPASLDLPNLVSVAAGDERIAQWSAHGARTVDLVAPGERLRSTLPGGRYGRRSGTSQAAAVVSAAAAVLAARAPKASPAALREALLIGAAREPGLRGRVVSGGRLDVRRALAVLAG